MSAKGREGPKTSTTPYSRSTLAAVPGLHYPCRMDRGEILDAFLGRLEFDLYPFQEEALLAWFEVEGGLLITAPTGMGKTLIAEAAIFEALQSGQRLYYTTPLIALTDQKFREFQDKAESWGFQRDDIGLITGNRKVNPDARVRVVVAEILLNHLLAGDELFHDVLGVVMDEFHYFNDPERGIVWELSLALMPPQVRLMLLSATVGNAVEFTLWAKQKHGRSLRLIRTDERRVPLEFTWVGDELLSHHLPRMVGDTDAENRCPALVFCFHRDECWEVAERLKGARLVGQAKRAEIEKCIDQADFAEGVGPKLRQMLLCGAGVHHAGVLPKHKQVVEALFLQKLIPFVICTETLAAGINLPARSTVLSTLIKGKRGAKKLIAASAAHQMFGRAGRPQWDKNGYVYVLAHEDDAKIAKWRKKYDEIDANSKDPGILRARKQLERKKPSRRRTEQYWSEGQFKTLIGAGPGNLQSRSMIPYQFLIYMLTRHGSLREVREFLTKRFADEKQIARFQEQLLHMVDNLEVFSFLTKSDDDDHLTLAENISDLLSFRSIDPLFGFFLARELARGSFDEKVQALEAVLPMPPAIRYRVRLPLLDPGPLQTQRLEPELLARGIITARVEQSDEEEDDARPGSMSDRWEDDEPREPSNLAEMLKALFEAQLCCPEDVYVQPKWVAGGLFEANGDFYKFCGNRNLIKNEGLVLRHLLRLVILAGEFHAHSGEDPDYARIGELCTDISRQVDRQYAERFLESEKERRDLAP